MNGKKERLNFDKSMIITYESQVKNKNQTSAKENQIRKPNNTVLKSVRLSKVITYGKRENTDLL